ncbi:dual specificity calcium/calmodulin-dependent 3',5'-cyclic nucleotide phosphodiesterase 1C isoform X5 [Salvelinus fontinalis]|uniref:dual specificity calcium/calmodulin-dependent 3',5'-cyclic nucleotide phosphodiesterase 1C isoform X5 n=1 Tax=Salvelinus fontinalis TaxID=8038 RepID=UPI0024856526|nr:dual specificity calcium/calmodulin-dependent 3',5'-cyclic nucleotide phosphodiesterase 1C isoform X5 [Salvelinus fontinalis]
MTEPSSKSSKKQGFKKCRSATFSIDGFSFTIVANKAGETNPPPLNRFARSKSQNALWNAITAGIGIKDKDKRGILIDPRSPEEILADDLPVVDGPDAMEKTAIRLRCLVKQLERGEASVVDLKKNLEYAASVLESVYIEETRRLVDTEDELSDIQSDSVPSEVRDWLASTFTRQMGLMLRRTEEKPRFRSIVHAVQAGIFVERMYRRTSNMVGLSYPPSVITVLKHVDMWSFDVFALNDASGDHALKFIFYELLTRYDLINRFKNWLTELEIFAMIFAAAVHDYEHTGTTNNFHIQTRSGTAILYNDRAVLENHHVSAAYRLLQDDDEMNILLNLSKDDWRELRALVVEMVLATDMSCHFQQIKAMKNFLQQPEAILKPKALSLILHTADISHPAKNWDLHHRWTTSLLEEFFRQGDKEAELGLPFSPLCDRKSTMVAQSQIGFIDFIVEPTFTVLSDMTEKIVTPLIDEASRSGLAGFRRSSCCTERRAGNLNSIPVGDGKRSSVISTGSEGSGTLNCSPGTIDYKGFKATWNEEVHQNREKWKTQAAKDLEEKTKREAEEKASQEETEPGTTEEKEEKKGRDEEGTQAEGEKKEVVEEVPKEEEGNKDPGGAVGTITTSGPGPGLNHLDPKEPETSSTSTEKNQQVQNGEVPEDLDSPDTDSGSDDDSEKNTSDDLSGSEGYDLIRYYKRPSYCANSHLALPSREKERERTEGRLIDPRSRVRKLQGISLRRSK